MLVSVDGVNPKFKDRVIEIMEAIPEPHFKYTTVKGQMASSVVFECDNEDDNFVIPFVKGTLRKSELGSVMMFRVAPYGCLYWQPHH